MGLKLKIKRPCPPAPAAAPAGSLLNGTAMPAHPFPNLEMLPPQPFPKLEPTVSTTSVSYSASQNAPPAAQAAGPPPRRTLKIKRSAPAAIEPVAPPATPHAAAPPPMPLQPQAPALTPAKPRKLKVRKPGQGAGAENKALASTAAPASAARGAPLATDPRSAKKMKLKGRSPAAPAPTHAQMGSLLQAQAMLHAAMPAAAAAAPAAAPSSALKSKAGKVKLKLRAPGAPQLQPLQPSAFPTPPGAPGAPRKVLKIKRAPSAMASGAHDVPSAHPPPQARAAPRIGGALKQPPPLRRKPGAPVARGTKPQLKQRPVIRKARAEGAAEGAPLPKRRRTVRPRRAPRTRLSPM